LQTTKTGVAATMPNLRRFLSRSWLLAFLAFAAVLFGLAMLHPYPRQSLFGPTIRGKPRCVWEAAMRRAVQPESFSDKVLTWLGVEREGIPHDELFDNAEMLPLVLELLEDEDYHLRGFVMGQILMWPSLQDCSALPALHKRLQNEEDIHHRLVAARAIWQIDKDKRVLSVFLELLDDKEPGLRALGVSYAAMVQGAPELFPAIAGCAKDSNHRVRGPVMFAMQHYGTKGVPILIDGLSDVDAEVRLNAVFALGFLGPQALDAVPALEARLNDADAQVRGNVPHTLQAIDRQRFKHLKGAERR
jgi:HEAT repeat protein